MVFQPVGGDACVKPGKDDAAGGDEARRDVSRRIGRLIIVLGLAVACLVVCVLRFGIRLGVAVGFTLHDAGRVVLRLRLVGLDVDVDLICGEIERLAADLHVVAESEVGPAHNLVVPLPVVEREVGEELRRTGGWQEEYSRCRCRCQHRRSMNEGHVD